MTTRTTGRERDAVEAAGRIGLATRGAIYLVVGWLAVLVAMGSPGSRPSRRGALETVTSQPLGRVLVTLVALGFAACAVWRAAEAVNADKWSKRLANAGRSLLYVGFFVTALRFVLHGSREGGSGNEEVDVTGRVLSWPGGRWVVIAIGLGIVAGGLWNGYRGLSQRYRKKLKWRDMSARAERVVPWIATFGLVGRMLAFSLVGLFVARAGWRHNPSDAGGIDVALLELTQRGYGPAIVAVVGAGVIAFGAFSLVEARFRQIPQPS